MIKIIAKKPYDTTTATKVVAAYNGYATDDLNRAGIAAFRPTSFPRKIGR